MKAEKREPMAVEMLRIRIRSAVPDPEAVELERMLDAALQSVRSEAPR